jgi:hypothetical protein
MKLLLQYLDWIGIMLPEKPDEHSLPPRIMALNVQLLAAIVIIGCVLI